MKIPNMTSNMIFEKYFSENQNRQKLIKHDISGPHNGQIRKSFRNLINFKPRTSQEDHL